LSTLFFFAPPDRNPLKVRKLNKKKEEKRS